MDQESSQQLQMWFSEHFFAPKLAVLFVTPIVFATVEQIWREKMSEKPHSIRLLRWFNFSQSGNRKNNRKTFEGASVEPTIRFLSQTDFPTSRPRLSMPRSEAVAAPEEAKPVKVRR